MNATQIHTTYKSVMYFLVSGKVKSAFEKIKDLVSELQVGEFKDRLEDLEQNYRFLLQYFVLGVEDLQRKTVYNKLISKTLVLNSELREELLIRNSTNFEYTQKRYFPHTKHHNSPKELLDAFNYFHKQSKLFLQNEENHEIELKRLQSNYELLFSELFRWFWLTTTYNSDDKDLFNQITSIKYNGWVEKSLLISALTLNLWRMFDESKLILLFDVCMSENKQVQQRALVGLCFVMSKYNRILTYFPQIRNRLVLLTDNQHIVENLQNIIIQIIATSETESITKKMQEEILPEMMKISPLLKDKMGSENLMNTDEWNEENPEWQEILEQSGIAYKLKELSEMQLEGADVYMSTFSMLKNFPFFNEFTNWFLPFDPNHSSVNELFSNGDKTLISAFVGNNIMCNSDKYSFCLSILQMPESQRNNLKHSFKMEAEQFDEMSSDEALLTPELASKNISKQYIQDLFRFFKLNPQHTDFKDMFSFSLSLHKTILFSTLSSNCDIKIKTAEYYFSKGHYSQAIELFEELQLESTPSTALFQKIGYMYQQTSQFSKAIDAYSKADFLQPNDNWTIRKLALCYRLTGDFEKALEFYQQADYLIPNNISTLMQIGHCFIQLRQYKEALSTYFKIDSLAEDNIKAWRAISWCSFVTGNLEQADYYLNKLLNNEPNAYDYINAGHIAFCRREITLAIEFYQKSIHFPKNNWELFIETFKEDNVHLINNGVDADEIPLLLDSLNAK